MEFYSDLTEKGKAIVSKIAAEEGVSCVTEFDGASIASRNEAAVRRVVERLKEYHLHSDRG